MELADSVLDQLLERLTLERKVQLLTGKDFWSTWPLEEIGLRSMVLSDGPSGVRGPVWDERSPSLSLPSATALSSSWDVELAAEYGAVSAAEARRKGVDVVLGPTINLHRSPLGGRHFEAFSEDPVLTSGLASAYVEGVQRNGVGATPKHYVANDFETERFTADVRVSDRALRELYLLAFERAVVESRAWLVMSAYNSVNGVTATEHELLETPLNAEWGFDGVVVSDWTAVRSIASARASQDLVMPGPEGAWGDALIAAVRSGDIAEEVVDRKVRRLLRLAARVGALEGFRPPPAPPAVDGVAFARRAAAEGMVLVRNDGSLPLEAARPVVAVIGHNAASARFQGGGSATVIPEAVVSPLDGIRAAFPDADVRYAVGAVVQSGLAELPITELRNPVTGGPGVRVEFLDAAGNPIFSEDRFATSFVWLGGDVPIEDTAELRVRTTWAPAVDQTVRLGFAGVGHGTVAAAGEVVVDSPAEVQGGDFAAALLSPPTRSGTLQVAGGRPIEIVATFRRERGEEAGLSGAMSFGIGLEPTDQDPEELIADAVALARDADVVVLVVGTNDRVESEGHDRADLRLPGHQDRLAEAVLTANSRTVVVVNAGAPVELPWADRAAAVLLTWFGGQEYGNALADVLTGAAEPGGRLPTTWPARMADTPVLDVTPKDGIVEYGEGIHIGYRAWLRAAAAPAYWFGAGSGYTTFEVSEPSIVESAPAGADLTLRVSVRNTGGRRGKHVLQAYASRPDSAIERPARWLVGFGVLRLDAGAEAELRVPIPGRAFAHWDGAGWAYEPGIFDVAVAGSADDPGLVRRVEIVVP